MAWNNLKLTEYDPPAGMANKLLEDVFQFSPLSTELVEADEKQGRPKMYKLRGKFGQCDEATDNGRVYSHPLMCRETDKLKACIEGRQLYGELGHPKDGKTELLRISHLIEDVKVHKNGLIEGTLVIIPGTPGGDTALAITEANGKLGVSSRGFGTTISDGKGRQIVQEDYMLVTWDLVADPASAGAYPKMVIEEKEIFTMKMTDLKEKYPQLIESLKAELKGEVESGARDHARGALKEEFENTLSEKVNEVKKEALDEATMKLKKDPEVAGAVEAMKTIVETVAPYVLKDDENSLVEETGRKLQEAEKRIASLDKELVEVKAENNELTAWTSEAYYHLFMEQTLGGDPRREQITSMVGDVKDFDSLDELKERVEEVKGALNEEDERQNVANEKVAHLEAKNALLTERLERALQAGNSFAIKAYIEKTIAKHPKAIQLRSFLSEAKTKKEVNGLVEDFDKQNPLSEEYVKIRAGLRMEKQTDGNELKVSLDEGVEVGGVPMNELAKLC